MAEQGAPPGADGGGNVLTRKVAGLPTWGWVGIAIVGGVIGLLWFRGRKTATTPDASTATPSIVDSSGIATGQYESLLALLRDIQGQPSETLPGPAGPQGPAGPPGPSAPLSAPTNVRTTGAIWPNFLEVHWDAVPGAASYVVRGANDDRNTAGPVNATMVGGLIHNGTYFISVAAKDSSGNLGPFSAPITAHTKN